MKELNGEVQDDPSTLYGTGKTMGMKRANSLVGDK